MGRGLHPGGMRPLRETVKRSDLAGWVDYGYCASPSRFFWGPRLHLLRALQLGTRNRTHPASRVRKVYPGGKCQQLAEGIESR
jgi:hypothetical protein